MKLPIEDALVHFPDAPPPELDGYTKKDIFPEYIFTTRQGKKQYGYCTHCEQDFEIEETLKHNEKAFCPSCVGHCTVKASGFGRGKLIDQAYYTCYMKSAVDQDEIVAIGYRAVRDFSGEYRGVKTAYCPQALYLFRPGVSIGYYRAVYYMGRKEGFWVNPFVQMGRVKCQFHRDSIGFLKAGFSQESIVAAVAGTPFEHSTWEHYIDSCHTDMVEFFDLAAKYPCVEYLTKLGFSGLVLGKIYDHATYSTVYWRGKTLQKVLRLSGRDLQSAKKNPKEVSFDVLNVLRESKKDGSNFTLEEAVIYLKKIPPHYLNSLPERCDNMRKGLNYLDRQYELGNSGEKKRYRDHASVILTWKDYIRECGHLGYDLTQKKVLFPKDLHAAHKETTKQVKIQANPEFDKKIRGRLRKLKKLTFKHGDLLIRPIESMEEIIEEGLELKHCVGGYADRHADGKSIIMVIRKADEPDKPFYTLEVAQGRVTQCYGYNHAQPTPDIWQLIQAFKFQRLGIKEKIEEVAV